MKSRQSLVEFAIKHTVAHASRRYNRARSYFYFWLKRYDGSLDSLACRSRRPHSHPSQHTEERNTLPRSMCKCNPKLGRVELWCRLRKRGYKKSLGGLYRVLHRLDLQPKPQKKVYYAPRRNGNVEWSHREDQKLFYNHKKFHSFNDSVRQLDAWQSRSNRLPMWPLGLLRVLNKLCKPPTGNKM